MKDLAQAISALINSSPYSPRVEEIEAVIRKHLPQAPNALDLSVTRIDPPAFVEQLSALLHPLRRKVPVPRANDLIAYAGQKGLIFHCRTLIIVDPRDDTRSINGLLVNPPRVHVCWYNEEKDCAEIADIAWKAACVLAPDIHEVLSRLVTAMRYATP